MALEKSIRGKARGAIDKVASQLTMAIASWLVASSASSTASTTIQAGIGRESTCRTSARANPAVNSSTGPRYISNGAAETVLRNFSGRLWPEPIRLSRVGKPLSRR